VVKWLIVVFLILISFSTLNAQRSVVKGMVKDSITNEPIGFVSIYLSFKEGNIISFAQTDDGGQYALEHDILYSDTLVVTANYLGYRKKKYIIFYKENEVIAQQNFLLKPINFELKEIVVKERNLPILQRKDTIIYDVNQFIDSTEYSIEDVLKKLPGVHVNEKGRISVNGQPINKVLIEGDDMFGANYTIGTKNVRGNIVNKVQIIDGYNDNPVLDGVSSSDKIAINIQIKENKKNVLSGNYTVGLGYGEDVKRHLNTNLFLISKKSKSLFLGNHNNDGFDAKGEVSVINAGTNRMAENQTPSLLSVIELPSVEHDFLPERLISNRRLSIANISQIVNLTPNFKLKLIGTHYQRRNSQNYSDFNTFYAPQDTLAFSEENFFQRKEIDTDVFIQTDYLSKKLDKSFRSTSSLATYSRKAELVLNRIENNENSNIPQVIKEAPLSFYNTLEYTQKLGGNAIYQLGSDHFFSENPQILNARYVGYSSLAGNLNLDSLRQGSNITQNISNAYFRYLYNKSFLLDVSIGIQYNHTVVESRSDLQNAEDSLLLYKNDISIRQLSPILKVLIKKKLSLFDVSVGVQNIFDKVQLMGDEHKYFRSMPFLQIFLPVSSKLHIKALYNYRRDLPTFNTINRQFIFNSYQSINKDNRNLELINTQRISTSLRYKNTSDAMFFNLSGFYSSSNNATGISFSFIDAIFEQSLYNPAPINGFGGTFNIEKLFWNINSRFNIEYSFSSYNTETRLNEFNESIQLFDHELLLDYGSSFDFPVNVYLTSRFNFIKSKLLISNTESSGAIINTKFKVAYEFSKNTYFDLKWYGNTNSGDTKSVDFFNTLDATFTHRIGKKNKKGRLSLTLSNLFNKKSFLIRDVGNFYSRENEIETTQRFFLVKWEPNF